VPQLATVWRRADKPGHEFCTLAKTDHGMKLTGVTVLTDAKVPCCLQYTIEVDAKWRTLLCRLTGYVGKHAITIDIRREGAQWLLNGNEVPEVAGAIDIDLGFSPSTNMLPIRRLGLEVGKSEAIRAAWLRFPELTLESLDQTYTRLTPDTFRYESGGGKFRRDLKVDQFGMIIDYPELWRAESRV
jgi:uncharacterized protein